ncbi:hypothetical protein COR50_01285 [Chitinophaga caeni]|uniref:Uncharacterized protein n=1 Tax=Chitinophaga caeni TaxID=2029983 RepID=A0A291QPU4_9BACT|nr:hypothetical protein [Chitinophaga caeni]ATL45902.1 hypothetical protein COR50_01285 [Chitinophaga caeni]
MSLTFQIEEFLLRKEFKELFVQVIKTDDNDIQEGEHLLDYLLRKGRQDDYNHIIKMNLIVGLLSDICYFTQEALVCSLKQRLTVTFSLLRKPFVYTLIIILRLLFEENFIEKFNNEEGFDPASVSPEDRTALINASIEAIQNNPITADDLNTMIFDKLVANSIINLSEKALHLTTTRSKLFNTEKQNFNFIFSNQESIDSQWEYIYSRLPALLLYVLQVADILVFTSIQVDEGTYEKRLKNRIKIFKKYSGSLG